MVQILTQKTLRSIRKMSITYGSVRVLTGVLCWQFADMVF